MKEERDVRLKNRPLPPRAEHTQKNREMKRRRVKKEEGM